MSGEGDASLVISLGSGRTVILGTLGFTWSPSGYCFASDRHGKFYLFLNMA